MKSSELTVSGTVHIMENPTEEHIHYLAMEWLQPAVKPVSHGTANYRSFFTLPPNKNYMLQGTLDYDEYMLTVKTNEKALSEQSDATT